MGDNASRHRTKSSGRSCVRRRSIPSAARRPQVRGDHLVSYGSIPRSHAWTTCVERPLQPQQIHRTAFVAHDDKHTATSSRTRSSREPCDVELNDSRSPSPRCVRPVLRSRASIALPRASRRPAEHAQPAQSRDRWTSEHQTVLLFPAGGKPCGRTDTSRVPAEPLPRATDARDPGTCRFSVRTTRALRIRSSSDAPGTSPPRCDARA